MAGTHAFTPQDHLRQKIFHLAYEVSHESDPTVRFVQALVLSAGPIDPKALAAYEQARKDAKGLKGRKRQQDFTAAGQSIGIRRRMAWEKNDEILRPVPPEAAQPSNR